MQNKGGNVVEKYIAGVRIEADHRGMIDALVAKFEIRKETEKMVYPLRVGNEGAQAIRYLQQIRKAELGYVTFTSYSNSFSFQCHDIVENDKQLSDLLEKIKNKVRAEINSRVQLSNKWLLSYKDMDKEVR